MKNKTRKRLEYIRFKRNLKNIQKLIFNVSLKVSQHIIGFNIKPINSLPSPEIKIDI